MRQANDVASARLRIRVDILPPRCSTESLTGANADGILQTLQEADIHVCFVCQNKVDAKRSSGLGIVNRESRSRVVASQPGGINNQWGHYSASARVSLIRSEGCRYGTHTWQEPHHSETNGTDSVRGNDVVLELLACRWIDDFDQRATAVGCLGKVSREFCRRGHRVGVGICAVIDLMFFRVEEEQPVFAFVETRKGKQNRAA